MSQRLAHILDTHQVRLESSLAALNARMDTLSSRLDRLTSDSCTVQDILKSASHKVDSTASQIDSLKSSTQESTLSSANVMAQLEESTTQVSKQIARSTQRIDELRDVMRAADVSTKESLYNLCERVSKLQQSSSMTQGVECSAHSEPAPLAATASVATQESSGIVNPSELWAEQSDSLVSQESTNLEFVHSDEQHDQSQSDDLDDQQVLGQPAPCRSSAVSASSGGLLRAASSDGSGNDPADDAGPCVTTQPGAPSAVPRKRSRGGARRRTRASKRQHKNLVRFRTPSSEGQLDDLTTAI